MTRGPGAVARQTLALAVLFLVACGTAGKPEKGTAAGQPSRPSILLVTLDTTRADAIGPEARGIETPAFDALAARGRRFRQAYATVPETLPSHSSMMTGLYPAGHGVHENARYLSGDRPVLAERLREAGYRTAAFVSSFVLARRFGLARGFDVYDDELRPGRSRGRPGRRRTGPSRTSRAGRRSRSSSGSTTSTRTRPTPRPSPSAAASRGPPTSARSRRRTTSSVA
jgi:arylsulfatase A-like enzyme